MVTLQYRLNSMLPGNCWGPWVGEAEMRNPQSAILRAQTALMTITSNPRNHVTKRLEPGGLDLITVISFANNYEML